MQDCYLRVFKIMAALSDEWEAEKEKKSSSTDPYYYVETYFDLFPAEAKKDFMFKCVVTGWEYTIFMIHFDAFGKVQKSCGAEYIKTENEYRKRPLDAYLNVDQHIQNWTIKVLKANKERLILPKNLGLAYFVSLPSTKMLGLSLMGLGYLPFIFPHPASQYYQKAFIRKIEGK